MLRLIPGEYSSRCEIYFSLTLWQSDWRSAPFYLCCMILSSIYFVPHKPEFVSFFKTLYWSTTLSICYGPQPADCNELFLLLLIIIIIIMSRRLRGYPWPSLAISPYHSLPPAGLQGYIPCPHIAAVCKFVLVFPLLHIHVWGSTGVHRLWARPCFSSSVLRVWFVELV